MNKKIGSFLMIMLVICAVLLLAATENRRPTATPPATTEPGLQSEAPSTGPEEPVVTVTPPLAAPPASDAASRVEQILARDPLDETAVSRRVYDGSMNTQNGTEGAAERSYAFALGELAQERRMNPVAAFWRLVSEGLYEKQEDQTGALSVQAFSVPAQEAKQYAYTEEGARLLLSDLLALAARLEEGLGLELALLGANLTVEPDLVFHAEAEECRYAYFVCSSERSTHILCFYLRTDGAGEHITDVELQLLNMCHATGDLLSLEELSSRGDRQAAALMAAAELLMTGQTRAGEGSIPFSGEGFTLERFLFTAPEEQGTLTNYRLRIN